MRYNDTMTEAELQDGIATAAQYAGWKVMHVRPARTESGWRTAVQYDGKGWPDLFLAHPDRGVMAIECKSRRGRLTLEQSDWLDTLAAAGVPVVVASPGNYDETITTITGAEGV